ncbi:hypothetical protein QQ054_35255 [Oscillatoria amoena NRMC-F 0135]|nr:hypothetical protein [Geitlerinema splendidum]MDL5051263.1 hypothetical protein [Oscillatoria amoena NRMC-F 0135]
MHPKLETLFEEAENRYLKPEELNVLSQYVESLPERLEVYRQIRDREIDIMQTVADRLTAQFPQESKETLERSIKNALLMLRYCAMAMLLNDEAFVKERLLGWLAQSIQTYKTQPIDSALYKLLNQQLAQSLTAKQINLLKPALVLAQTSLLKLEGASEPKS